MAALSSSTTVSSSSFIPIPVPHGSSLSLYYNNKPSRSRPSSLAVRSSTNRGGGPFIGGFVLGGMLAGTLSCIYAPQISQALMGGATRNDSKKMLPDSALDKKEAQLANDSEEEKLPEVVEDEEGTEITREYIEAKIAEINSQFGIGPRRRNP